MVTLERTKSLRLHLLHFIKLSLELTLTPVSLLDLTNRAIGTVFGRCQHCKDS